MKIKCGSLLLFKWMRDFFYISGNDLSCGFRMADDVLCFV